MSDQEFDRDDQFNVQGDNDSTSQSEGDQFRSDGERINSLVPASDMLPERIYLLPIHNRPFFPAQVQPLVINRERWEETMRRGQHASPYRRGCLCR